MGAIVLVRHGQTEWSASGRHTSRTDLDLTPEGERQAQALAKSLADRSFAAVFSSPRRRALRTAELAGIEVTAVVDELAEWDYGEYEGLTTPEIHRSRPDWVLWTDGCPGGESPEQVGARLDRALARVRPVLPAGDVALISHGHALRVLASRWIGQPASFGAHLSLGTATLSELGHEHELPTIRSWNI